jgi:nucleoside-diphosphate-sugar epimerase
MPDGPQRVVFTGGSGLAGSFIVPHLSQHGYTVLNLDIRPPPKPFDPPVHTIVTDLSNPGSVFNALTSNSSIPMPERWPSSLPTAPDVVVHFAGFSTPLQVPDNETFRVNVLGMHNVIEAACKLGVRKIIVASSVTVYGGAFSHGEAIIPPDGFPLDESSITEPTNTYALSKVCGERIAKSFAQRFTPNVDIYILRIARITTPDDYTGPIFKSYIENPDIWAPHGWSYTDIHDLAKMVQLCIQKDGLGYQVFNATNDSITNYLEKDDTTSKFLKRVTGRDTKREMGDREAPLSNRLIKEVLGFREEKDWRERVPKEWKRKDSEEKAEEKVMVKPLDS